MTNDDQNFDIDIDQIYTDWISEIDKIRSYVNISSAAFNFKDYIKSFRGSSFGLSKSANNVKAETTIQESRCHAFFRMIGFPVVGSDNKFYNGGLDLTKGGDFGGDILLDTKIGIALDPINGFNNLSNARETRFQDFLKVFSIPSSIEASVLVLLNGTTYGLIDQTTNIGGINLRKFSQPIEDKAGSLDTTIKKYSIGTNMLIWQNAVLFSDLQDSNGNTAKNVLGKFGKSLHHIITPFIVDPRIDFTTDNKICVPFVPSKSYTKIGVDNFAPKPLIEKIIRDRISNKNNDTTGTNYIDLQTFIQDNPIIQDQALVNNINTQDIYQISDKQKFLQFLKIAKAMGTRLVQSIQTIQTAQNQYYWLPLPNTSGPEKGCSVRNMIININAPQTQKDLDIITRIAKSQREQLNSDTASINGTPDIGDFAGGKSTISILPSETKAFVDNNTETLDRLLKQRNEVLDKANRALQNIEIIMGEFNGLGLCDIIVIIYALYIVDFTSLLGFLDDNAYNRMFKVLGLTPQSLPKSGINAMTAYFNTVSNLYKIMDQIFEDLKTSQSS